MTYWLDNRFKIIFALAVESGLRISDILKLKVKDVEKNPMRIYETKSKRDRVIWLSDELHKDLLYMCNWARDNDYVFNSHAKHGVPVHRSTIHRHIKKALKWVDFDASAHSARKLYAHNVYEDTGSVEKVQKAMNHQKYETTLTYLDIPQQDGDKTQKSATQSPKFSIFSIFKKIFGKRKKS